MKIPKFPEFSPIIMDFKEELYPSLSLLPDGISEYTFPNLYIWRNQYNYKISRGLNNSIIISGTKENKNFFMTPCTIPDNETLKELFKIYGSWERISESVFNNKKEQLEKLNIELTEERDNFDYIYLRTDLAKLQGRKYHKKRNLIKDFINSYKVEEHPLTEKLIPDAVKVLDKWKANKGIEGDYQPAMEALKLFGFLKIRGAIYYIDNNPAGWVLGESIAKGRMFAIHFEKALSEYKGIYQFINQAFASLLPSYYRYINREQDLGDEGLRQSKMSYYPASFIKKYKGTLL